MTQPIRPVFAGPGELSTLTLADGTVYTGRILSGDRSSREKTVVLRFEVSLPPIKKKGGENNG